jgi:hypothetical protein
MNAGTSTQKILEKQGREGLATGMVRHHAGTYVSTYTSTKEGCRFCEKKAEDRANWVGYLLLVWMASAIIRA